MLNHSNKITLSDDEIKAIIDALIFLACDDVKYEHLYNQKNIDLIKHFDNDFKLRLAKYLKKLSGIDCSDHLYVKKLNDLKDKKELDFVIRNFNVRILD